MSTDEIAPKLRQIVQELVPRFGSDALRVTTDKLNAVGQADWSRRYILSVHNGTLEPSAKLADAVDVLAAVLDGIPARIAASEQITVSVDPGAVRPGAFVMGKSRVCANPACSAVFVPNVPWRRFCGMCEK